jgi:aminocarboxymuconate-semialdehyde decarboxylase
MNGINEARVIDCHAHIRIEVDMGPDWKHGPEYGVDSGGKPWYRIGNYRLAGVKHTSSPFTDAELRIQAMAGAGIDFQLLSPSPLTYFHFINDTEGIEYCRRWNDSLSRLIHQYPNKLAGLATLPMQSIEAASAELRRAIQDLGLSGAAIGTDFGMPLDSAELDPLYETLCEVDVPLFIHPGPAGLDGPPGDPNLKRFDLDVVCGFAAQISIFASAMAEVRHPFSQAGWSRQLKSVLGHPIGLRRRGPLKRNSLAYGSTQTWVLHARWICWCRLPVRTIWSTAPTLRAGISKTR